MRLEMLWGLSNKFIYRAPEDKFEIYFRRGFWSLNKPSTPLTPLHSTAPDSLASFCALKASFSRLESVEEELEGIIANNKNRRRMKWRGWTERTSEFCREQEKLPGFDKLNFSAFKVVPIGSFESVVTQFPVFARDFSWNCVRLEGFSVELTLRLDDISPRLILFDVEDEWRFYWKDNVRSMAVPDNTSTGCW